jgi:predicted RNA polymerase sigma factor
MDKGLTMTQTEKKIAAALAAVSAFMQQEEEALHAAVAAAMAPPKSGPAMDLNLWGQSGRQGMMQMRSLMQMRAFDRFR